MPAPWKTKPPLPGINTDRFFFIVAQRTFIVPTQTIIHGEFAADLPGILSKQRKCFHEDQARGIAQRDAGTVGIQVTAEKVSQAQNVGVISATCPGTLRSVESQRAQAVPMVELFKLGAAEFSTKAKLMLAHGVGDYVGEVASDIFAALRRRLADAIEAGDGDVRGACQTGGVEIGRKIKAVRGNLES